MANRSGSGCCGAESDVARFGDIPAERRRLDIDFLYLDLSVCTRCQGTDASLHEAISEIAGILATTGVEAVLRKVHVQDEEQARELGFISSPTIRINGWDIQPDVKESLCEPCGLVCGEPCDCRVWTYQGREYTAPPKAMIIEAILREAYGRPTAASEGPPPPTGDIPDNLRRAFAARRKKGAE